MTAFSRPLLRPLVGALTAATLLVALPVPALAKPADGWIPAPKFEANVLPGTVENDPIVRTLPMPGVTVLPGKVEDDPILRTPVEPGTRVITLAPGEAQTPSTLRVPDSERITGEYGTFSAALVGLYASRAGVGVDEFLALKGPELPQPLSMARGALDAKSLDASLRSQGLSFNGRKVSDLSAWANQLATKPSPDSAVTLAASRWAAEAMRLQMPRLNDPKLAAPGVPQDALMFGLFANRSLTALATDHPDIFAEVSRSGLGTSAQRDAWGTSMLRAWDSVNQGLDTTLLDPCSASFMAGMASGSARTAASSGGRQCGGCAATGLAAHHYMNRLFAGPEGNSTLIGNTLDGSLNATEWGAMQGWIGNGVVQGNPQATAPSAKAPTAACSVGVSGDRVAPALTGVFGQLTNRR
jgi:hypothetical protein